MINLEHFIRCFRSSRQLLRRSLSSQTDNMVKNKKFILVKHFEGEIDKFCLKLEEENVPTLKANGK